MILAALVLVFMMPLVLVIVVIEKAKATRLKRKWQAEHIDVSYRKPSPFEGKNNDFIRAVNKYVVNNVKGVLDIKTVGSMLSNVVTVYVTTDEGLRTMRLFKVRTDTGWDFTENPGEETPKPEDEDDSPQGEEFNEDDFAIVESLFG